METNREAIAALEARPLEQEVYGTVEIQPMITIIDDSGHDQMPWLPYRCWCRLHPDAQHYIAPAARFNREFPVPRFGGAS